MVEVMDGIIRSLFLGLLVTLVVFTVRSFVAVERAIKRMDELLTEAEDDEDEDAPPEDWRELVETGWAKAKRHEKEAAHYQEAFERLRQAQDAPRVVALRVVRENVMRLQVWLPQRNADMVSRDAVLAILDAEIGATVPALPDVEEWNRND